MGRIRYGLAKKSTFIIILLGLCAILVYEGWFAADGSPFGISTITPRFWNLEPTRQMISTSRQSTMKIQSDVQHMKNIQNDVYNAKKSQTDVQNMTDIPNNVQTTKKIQKDAPNIEKVQGGDVHTMEKIHNDVQNTKKIQSGVQSLKKIDDSSLSQYPSVNASLKPNSTDVENIAHAILNSTILEHYFRTVPNITKDHKDTITSAKYSVLEIMNEPKVGQNFTVQIHARDGLNRPKTHGGDFWLSFLEFPGTYYASTSAPVQDHHNGTYTVDFFIGWASAVEIKITLVHPREAVQVLDLIRSNRYPPRLLWNGTFISKDSRTASTLCYLDYSGPKFWKDRCSYENGRALGADTALLCERPPEGFGCNSLVKYTTAKEVIRDASYGIGNACGCIWLFEGDHCMQPMKPQIVDMVQHLGSQYEILDNITKSLPLCNSHYQSGIGFWRADYWVSMVCQVQQWHKFGAKRVGECLRNKDMYFLGDSTTRQWVFSLLDILKSPVDPSNYATTYDFKYNKYFDSFNLNVTFQFHPHIIGSKEVYLENEMYEVDVIDSLQNSDCNYIVVISPWAHFAQWWRNAFVDRMRLLRESVERLKKRCPDAKVVLKGPHVREHGNMYTQLLYSDYIIFKIKEEIEEAFKGADIYYINVWDLNSGFKGKKAVHMPTTVIRQELSILLSYLCSLP